MSEIVAYAVKWRGQIVKVHKRINHATAYVTRNTRYSGPVARRDYEVIGLVEGPVVRRYDE